MRGIVTFTTDFGHQDPFVAVMKGQVLRRAPDAALVDITHDIAPFRPAEAGFWLARIAPYFPAGTVHLAVVDPGVGTVRGFVAALAQEQLFLAPDNGLLSELASAPGVPVRTVAATTFAAIGAAAIGPSFHGRDLLAPLAAELATGRLPFPAIGELCRPLELPAAQAAVAVAGGWLGSVVIVDHFGNLMTNIDGQRLAGGPWQAEIAGRRARSVGAYAEGGDGELIALVNAWGLVEVAIHCGNAAETLGAGRGDAVRIGPGGGS
jgi:S-adenosylmethionine hydrolase